MSQPSQKGEFTGRHMLIIMLCFFGVIITVNMTMAYIAGSSWTGLVVKSSFVASQQFNSNLEKAKAQKALGWSSNISYANGIFSFSLEDADGKKMAARAAHLTIGRPAYEQEDHKIELTQDSNVSLSARGHLQPGLWTIQATADIDGQLYHREIRMLVTPDGRGILQ